MGLDPTVEVYKGTIKRTWATAILASKQGIDTMAAAAQFAPEFAAQFYAVSREQVAATAAGGLLFCERRCDGRL